MATLEAQLALLIAAVGADVKALQAASPGEVRSDTTTVYSYMGTAAAGTATSSSGWTIARIKFPTVTTAIEVKHATGIWNSRAGLTYV